MVWSDVGTFWGGSKNKDKVSLKSKERVEDVVNNIDVDDEHTDRHADTCTWSDILSRGTIGGKNVQQ